MTPDDLIKVNGGSRAIKPIQRLNLAAVIEARMSDIAEYVWSEIKESGYAGKLAAGIVLTGGGASLDHIADLFQKVTKQEVRVSCAEMGVATESLEKVASPNLSMVVSLLLRGAKVGPCPVGVLQTPVRTVKQEAVVENPIGTSVVPPITPAEPVAPSQPVAPSTPAQQPDAEPAPKTVADVVAEKIANAPKEEDDVPEEDDIPRKPRRRILGILKDWMDDAFRQEERYGDDDDEY